MSCCKNITEQDTVFAQYMGNVYDYLSDLICNVEHYEEYGDSVNATKHYDMMNDVYYMFTYGWIAKLDQDKKILAASLLTGCVDNDGIKKSIWEEYKFDCMVDYWKCKHNLDLNRLLLPFGLNYGYDTGIDYMRIENTDPCVPPFKIV